MTVQEDKNPRCPLCHIVLEQDDSLDFYIDISEASEKVVGHCPKCTRNYIWWNVYTFEKTKDLEESE